MTTLLKILYTVNVFVPCDLSVILDLKPCDNFCWESPIDASDQVCYKIGFIESNTQIY